ncbi:MAG: TlpA family protein disulfide reductase [Selenomonadaceae bacterium]|nr:TlpA family protein disulfide reductase [Selenomonadaceae bacterium]
MKRINHIASIMLVTVMLLLSTGCFAEKAADKTSDREKFPAFKTLDLAGNTVTQEIFKGKKVTVINIWGTFCPPCKEEMPALGAWAKEMPKDAQIIGIVCDAKNENDKRIANAAVKIMESSNAKFVNLLPSKEIMTYLENVAAVPTTIFVDSEGNILGQPVVGADVEKYKARVREYLK